MQKKASNEPKLFLERMKRFEDTHLILWREFSSFIYCEIFITPFYILLNVAVQQRESLMWFSTFNLEQQWRAATATTKLCAREIILFPRFHLGWNLKSVLCFPSVFMYALPRRSFGSLLWKASYFQFNLNGDKVAEEWWEWGTLKLPVKFFSSSCSRKSFFNPPVLECLHFHHWEIPQYVEMKTRAPQQQYHPAREIFDKTWRWS